MNGRNMFLLSIRINFILILFATSRITIFFIHFSGFNRLFRQEKENKKTKPKGKEFVVQPKSNHWYLNFTKNHELSELVFKQMSRELSLEPNTINLKLYELVLYLNKQSSEIEQNTRKINVCKGKKISIISIMVENEDDWQVPPMPDPFNGQKRDKVILKNIPNGFSRDGLLSMCGLYGKVQFINQPPNVQFAFVQYESAEEANNILRRFKDDNPTLNIVVEIAREREREQLPNVNNDDYDFLHKPMLVEDNTPLRNVLELSSRKIKGPFVDPVEITIDSLVQGKDYRNRFLLLADPSKDFLWDSNAEANIEFETNNNRTIVHGRAILKSNTVKPTENNVSPAADKKIFSFNSDLLASISKCANCPRAADKMCKNCNEPQCSLECHAAKQKQLNEAKPSNKIENEKIMSPRAFLLSSSSSVPGRIEAEPISKLQTVKITAVINHRLVFVRPADDQQEAAFVRLMCDTVKYARDAKAFQSLPSVGSLVLAKFDYYQRALVLKHVDNTKVAVAFIDFGNVEIRDFHELKAMPDELKNRKRFATKIRLNKIDDDFMNEKALKYLYNIMAHARELTIKFDSNDTVPMAELRASDKWVNQMINSLNIEDIEVAYIKDMSYRIFFGKEFNQRCGQNLDPKEMSGVEVIILDNSEIGWSFLTFIKADDFQKFLQNDRRIQNICNYLFKADACYTPKNEECCAVRHKGHWYRAYCLEVCFDGFVTMHFLDYGNMQTIEVNDVRAIPNALLFECFAIEANCFSDHEDITPELIAKFKDQYPEKSRHKIKRMEINKKIDQWGNDNSSLCAWF
ncbi:protein vreteno [Sitodiplosis mosellana]|uniref:protein vreteno n=1 Tax=Sitodiplosis mosellana TaxID=263140 RepID=UPI002444D026|nr:protein vreteno [Sitodiplosis mosellana]